MVSNCSKQNHPKRSYGTAFLWGGLISFSVALGLGGLLTRHWSSALGTAVIALPASYLGYRVQKLRETKTEQNYHLGLGREVQGLELRLMDLEHYEEQLYQAIASAQGFNQNLETENQQLRTERFYLSEQISSLRNKRQELVKRFSELTPQKQQLEKELRELCDKIELASDRRSEIEKSLAESNCNVKIIENSCNFIREELAQLHQEILEKVKYRDELQRQVEALETQSQSFVASLEKMTQQQQDLRDELGELETQRTSLTEICSSLQYRVESLSREEDALSYTIQEKRQEMAAVEGCIEYLHQEYHHLQTHVADIQNQVSFLNEDSTLNFPESSLITNS